MTALPGNQPPDGAANGGPPWPPIASGWAAAAGVPGTRAWAPRFEEVLADLQRALPGGQPSGPMWYPPVMPRADAERAGYAESFRHLLGSVHTLPEPAERNSAPAQAGPADARGDFSAADVVLVPAMCYHIYPLLAGQEIARPAMFDLAGYCYRQEKTHEPGRLRAYRVREHVAITTADAALSWRDEQMELASAFFRTLGLPVRVQAATDPFFGRGGHLLRATQLEQRLKFEFVCPVTRGDGGTAIASANYHKTYFGTAFGIRLADGSAAHSACLGFGLERIGLALICAHGNNRDDWPDIAAAPASQRGRS